MGGAGFVALPPEVTALVIALTLCYLLVAEAARHFFYRLSGVKPAAHALPTLVSGAAH